MELIERPKKVDRAEQSVQNNEYIQKNAQSQLNKIYDYLDDLAEEFSDIGSNSNGTYIKFPNGLMICYLDITVTDQAINTQYSNTSLYIGSRIWTFPKEFIEIPVVTCGMFRWSTGASWGSVAGTSTNAATLRGYDFISRASGTATIIRAIAIGKWK